jgi:hypothetical protein
VRLVEEPYLSMTLGKDIGGGMMRTIFKLEAEID